MSTTDVDEISGHVSENMKKLTAVLERIRQFDFAKHANALRPGFNPVVHMPADASSLQRGGINVHVPITFCDGVRWLARIRQESTPGAKLITESEGETMRVLKASGLQVPDAFLPRDPDANFFFVELLEGYACAAPIASGTLTNQQQHDLIRSIASFYVNLSTITFSQIGSVVREPATNVLKVGCLISPDFCQNVAPFFFGPFKSSAHRYLAHIEHVLHEIEQHRAFSDGPFDTYVAHLWLRDLIQQSPRLREKETIHLKHADDKGDQIMVDKDGNFVGIIDWEWAYTASKSEAFAAPLALVDVEAFFDGVNDLSPGEEKLAKAYEELGRPDLAACVRTGKVYQRLPMIVGQAPDVIQLHAFQHALTGQKGEEGSIEEWVAAKINGIYGADVAALKMSIQN
ncbi:hypothetical protein BDP27DRAFT_428575 [Rhodocollybia butyracea]|uniref:Aminoglycoside phosphotransferase domain-containing protein n=1 Tax=Rhodocollybia butyracea TaxID=206335 RepID=A0A9P5UAT0_9AGAR|nr:hypothetical protein BDP27DRAFT_428575 [Rhodocollybia butyracea]